MLDILGLYYVLDEIEDSNVQHERLNTIMADHLRYTWNELLPDEKNSIQKDWPELFEADGSRKKYPRVNTYMFINGTNKNVSLTDEAKGIRHIYSIFSKFEHNGVFTFDMIHNPYYADGKAKIKFMIKEGIVACMIALKLISNHWLEKENPLHKKIKDVINATQDA